MKTYSVLLVVAVLATACQTDNAADVIPKTTITSGPAALVNVKSAVFEFVASEEAQGFQCKLDTDDWSACSSSVQVDVSSDGSHSFYVRAVAADGKTERSPASWEWVVDTLAPKSKIASGPSTYSNTNSATFTLTANEKGVSYQCSLDAEPIASCKATTQVDGLADGAHEFQVAVQDEAGNLEKKGQTWQWTVDTATPTASITSGPPNPTTEPTAEFVFSCSEANCVMECSFDGGAFASCSPKSFAGGAHTLAVRARDLANNLQSTPATWNWTVKEWSRITAGFRVACGLKMNGTLWCWGEDYLGQVGDGNGPGANVLTPLEVAAGQSTWTDVNSAENHVCAVLDLVGVYCWGVNATQGRLGLGTTVGPEECHSISCSSYPRLTSAGTFASVSASKAHSCAIAAGELFCWGYNSSGELGVGDTLQRSYPVKVSDTSDWADVSTGGPNSCAIKVNGTLWCWGSSTPSDILRPKLFSGASWAKVSAGNDYVCALKTNGELWCWGVGYEGQLGDGLAMSSVNPTQVSGTADWVDFDAGDQTTCGIRSDGSLWCWGSNWYGMLGVGQTLGPDACVQHCSKQPIRVGTDSWLAVSVGVNNVCGIRDDTTLWCWGDGGSGAIGDGALLDRSSPTQTK